MTTLTEADVEQVALEWLQTNGWSVSLGRDLVVNIQSPDAPTTGKLYWSGSGTPSLYCIDTSKHRSLFFTK